MLDAPSRTFPHQLPRDQGTHRGQGNACSGPGATVIALNMHVLGHSPHKNVLPGEALIPPSGLGLSWPVAELNLKSRLVWLLMRVLCTSVPREAEKETETEAGVRRSRRKGFLLDASTVAGRGQSPHSEQPSG